MDALLVTWRMGAVINRTYSAPETVVPDFFKKITCYFKDIYIFQLCITSFFSTGRWPPSVNDHLGQPFFQVEVKKSTPIPLHFFYFPLFHEFHGQGNQQASLYWMSTQENRAGCGCCYKQFLWFQQICSCHESHMAIEVRLSKSEGLPQSPKSPLSLKNQKQCKAVHSTLKWKVNKTGKSEKSKPPTPKKSSPTMLDESGALREHMIPLLTLPDIFPPSTSSQKWHQQS